MSNEALAIEALSAGYRGGTVLEDVGFQVGAGQVVALLGRNGVGKTTLLSAVMGLVRPYRGSVRFEGRELAGAAPDVVARAGIGLVPQGRRIFAPLSVEENLGLAVRRRSQGPWNTKRIYELFPRLTERRKNRGDQLSGGEQQMLAIGRALLGNPRLLLLDEPSDGLALPIVRQVTDVLRALRAEGMSIVLVEQNLRMAFTLADEIAVMQKGRIVHRVATAAFRSDPDTARRLLGTA